MSRAIILIAHNHNLGHEHRHLESVFVLHEHDILSLESGHAATTYLIQESDLITYLHLYTLLYKYRIRGQSYKIIANAPSNLIKTCITTAINKLFT